MKRKHIAPVLMTQREYAEHRRKNGLSGISRSAVQLALRTGRISTVPNTDRIDPVQADKDWAQLSEPRPSKVGSSSKARRNHDYDTVRAWRAFYEAELAELRVRAATGELIDSKLVVKLMFSAGRIVRAGHDDMVAQLAPDIASEQSAERIESMLRNTFKRIDAELSAFADKLDDLINEHVDQER